MSGQIGIGESGNAGQDPSQSELGDAPAPQRDGCSGDRGPHALCFSGGGIRSATFNLGVLQELARTGRLKTFDYLSTVSGGGYIGAWFVAQIARARNDRIEKEEARRKAKLSSLANDGEDTEGSCDPQGPRDGRVLASQEENAEWRAPSQKHEVDKEPTQGTTASKPSSENCEAIQEPQNTEDTNKEQKLTEDEKTAIAEQARLDVIQSLARADEAGEPQANKASAESLNVPLALKWLRDYSNYLSPTWGLSKDALSLASIYLRNLAIHWMILLPVLLAALLVPRVVHRIVQDASDHVSWIVWAVVASTLLMAAFSTNGPPAEGEERSSRVNLVWHAVCFTLPLLVIPIGLIALVSTKEGLIALNGVLKLVSFGVFPTTVFEDGFERWETSAAGALSTAAGFAFAGAVLYLCGSLLLLFVRSLPWILYKDGDWRFRMLRRLKFEPSAIAAKNFEKWSERFPLRLALGVVSGALIGAFCGLAAAISAANASSWGMYPELRTALLPVLFVFAIWLGSVLRVAIATRASNELAREWWARATGATLVGLLVWVVLALLVLWLPLFVLELPLLRTGWAAGTAGLGGFLFAAATAAVGFWSKHGTSLEQHVERWRDRLGKRLTEIAALVTLLGASLLLNLLVGQAASQPARSRQDSSATAMLYACASSARANVLGADVNAFHPVTCSVGGMLLADMPGRGFSEADIEGARNRFVACCVLKPDSLTLASDQDVCPSGSDSLNRSSVEERSTGVLRQHAVDMPCVLSTESKEQSLGKKGESGTTGHAAQVKSTIHLPAALPWSIRMAADYRMGLEYTSTPGLLLSLLGMLVFSILMAWRTGANTYSLQSMYANRLVRAYLGASNFSRREVDPQLRFNDSDDMPLHQLKDIKPELVINAALNHTRAEPHTLAWQQRKASHFTFTPSLCGSRAAASVDAAPMLPPLGFQRTEYYRLDRKSAATGNRKEDRDLVTLGQAISLSGAAVSPSMGYHSSPAVSAVLALFNLRLGSWALRPQQERGDGTSTAHTFWQRLLDPWCLLLKEFSSSVGTRGRFVYLSDGGHFENLGVYSMLQQRCRYILVVDAGADPAYEFADLENLVRKARVDLGVEIKITEAEACMKAIREGRLRYLHARICYPGSLDAENAPSTEGELVLVKPVLCGDEPFDVLRYAETVAKRGSRFPQQSTSDQFFDEAQFESYRILGRHSVREVLGEDGKQPPRPMQAMREPQVPLAAQQPQEKVNSPVSAVGTTGSQGWMSGAIDAVNSLGSVGQAAVLASAIGVIGVTGVVTLKDPTVSIDQASLQELRDMRMAFDDESLTRLQDLNWKVDLNEAGQVRLDVSGLGAQLTDGLKQIDWSEVLQSPAWVNLRQELASVRGEIALTLQNPGDPAIRVRVENPSAGGVEPDLLDRLDNITRALDSAALSVQRSTQNLDGVVTRLRDAVDELSSAVEAGNPKNILEALGNISKELGEIASRIDEISPRNTVRASR